VNCGFRLAEYIEKQKEMEKEKQLAIQKKIDQGLKLPGQKKVRFDDPSYFEETENMVEEVKQVVKEGST
jgi:hypothetical protein